MTGRRRVHFLPLCSLCSYETGRKATAQMKQHLRIVFDHILPKWNYRAMPQCAT